MKLNSYLSFDGNCRAAFDYYVKHLGAKMVMCMTYADAPPQPEQAACLSEMGKDKIMHARLDLDGVALMGSDCPPGSYEKPAGFNLSLQTEDPKEAERLYRALSENGTIKMPLAETFWAHRFGMVADQFGVPWMINCEKEQY